MAGEKNAGSIVYEISADVEPLLQGGKQAIDALDKLDAAAQQSGKGMDNLDQSTSQTGSAFTELAGYASSMDNQLRKLNTSVSGIARAMEEARTGTGSTTSEFNRANAVIEALGNQVAILEEAQENGARSAAVFASQLRAGANATEEEKRTIAELAGAFYDLKASSDEAAKSTASIAAATQRAESSISGLEKEVSILNTEMQAGSRSAAVLAAQLSAGEGASDAQKAKIAQLAGSLFDMREAQKSASAASAEAARQLAQQANEANRISGITSDLSHQIAILSEQQTNGARSAAILAAQLRAGASATDADKQKIAQLTGQLYDMKTSVDTGAKSHGNWKSSLQQTGYQVQDFIVQVQGGQSALVAFSQQGSQLAGAFGPGGAVIGAIIALSTVVAGTLVASLGNGKNAIDALKDAIETTDKVISISQNGVGALSEKYAALARVNIQVATLMRNQAEIELQSALAKVSTEVQKASKDFIGFGDSLVSSLGGGYASVKLFNDYLSTLSITTNDFSEAMKQAAASGRAGQTTMQSMIATVGALAGKFDLTDQQAYEFAKQLSDIAKNPSDEKLNALIVTLQKVGDGQSSGAKTAREYAARLLEIATTSADASVRLKALKEMTDSLTSSQDKALKQARQELFITRQTGDEKMKAQAWRDAENQGIKEGTQAFRDYYNVRLQTYQQQEANTQASKAGAKATKEAASAAKSSANAEESITKKLQNLRAASDLTTESIEKRRIEEAGLRAEQSLGNKASQQQLAEAKALGEANEKAAISIQRRKEAEQGYKQVQGAASPVAGIDNNFQTQMQELNEYAALYPQKIAEVEAVRASIEAKYRQERQAAMWAEWSQQNVATQLFADTLQTSMNTVSSSITGILNGTQTLNEALGNIANTVLSSVVQSFVQMGVEWVKSAIMGQTAQIAATAATTSAAVAGTATTTAASVSSAAVTTAAWTPAAIVASIGTFGGAAAIGIGAVIAAMAMAGGIAGKRKNGGPVSAGSMYQVGEGGMPEIYQASNGSQYMIPGDNGKVISNKDMQGGGGGGVVINIQNYTPATVDAQASPDGKGGWTVDAFIYDMDSGGPASQAIQRNHQAPRKARG
ncbi:tail protein (tape measure) [Cronobacter turicensis]